MIVLNFSPAPPISATQRQQIHASVLRHLDQRFIVAPLKVRVFWVPQRSTSWKGNRAGYQACHMRVIAARGRPSECEECGTTDSNKYYDWANLTGNYHDVDDYRRLCRSCHWELDKTILNLHGGKEKCPQKAS